MLVGQRLPLLAQLPNAKAIIKDPSRYHQDMTQIKCHTLPCSRQVCGGVRNLLGSTLNLTESRDQHGAMHCEHNWLDLFQQKMLIHQNPNFLWEQRASDEISLSLGGRGLKSKAGRQARLLEEAPVP